MQPYITACLELLDESLVGPADPRHTWVVSTEPASGLVGTLDALSAEQASRAPAPGARTAAAHAQHELFALDLARRRLEGEDPAAATGADWEASWGTAAVTEPMWANLRAELRRAGTELRQTIESKQHWSDTDVKGLAATLGHLAYHLGAIRQIARAVNAGVPDAPRCG